MSRKIEAYGVRGMKSKPWRRTFASQAAFERFLVSPAADNVSVLGTRDIEDSMQRAAAAAAEAVMEDGGSEDDMARAAVAAAERIMG